jgi:diguanylate cyclase (GGDEF)-like protein
MQIDGSTVVLMGLLARTLLGILFLVFWLRDKRAVWFLWWSATFFLGDVAALSYLLNRFVFLSLPFGYEVAILIAAMACVWQGARTFEGREPLWLPVLVAPTIWMFACLIPGFLETASYRVVLSSLLLSPLAAMSAVEFWRGREERLPSRWAIILLFASLSMFFASRIALLGIAPFPFGAQPMQSSWVGAFSLILVLTTIVLAVLIVAMTRERLEREQMLKAQTDLLTGAFNRRAFLTYGERLIMRHRVAKKPLCLVLFDLDQFKELNDQFGHIGGDQFLTKFVAVAYNNIRPGDFLFRLGGDEFCCLLPETDTSEALMIAERMRRQIAATTIDIADVPVNVTASIGIASTESFGYSLDALLYEADIATYAAKGQGRNQVAVAAPDSSGASPESQEPAPAAMSVVFSGGESGRRVRRKA